MIMGCCFLMQLCYDDVMCGITFRLISIMSWCFKTCWNHAFFEFMSRPAPLEKKRAGWLQCVVTWNTFVFCLRRTGLLKSQKPFTSVDWFSAHGFKVEVVMVTPVVSHHQQKGPNNYTYPPTPMPSHHQGQCQWHHTTSTGSSKNNRSVS